MLIRLKDKKRIPLELKKDEEKSNYGLSVEEGNTYHVFIFSRFYSKLDKIGYVGTRNPLGWGIKIAKEEYVGRDLLLNSEMQLVKKLAKTDSFLICSAQKEIINQTVNDGRDYQVNDNPMPERPFAISFLLFSFWHNNYCLS